MGSRRTIQINRLERELRLARQRQFVRLNRQYLTEARQLTEAYDVAITQIRSHWDDYLSGRITRVELINLTENTLNTLSSDIERVAASLQYQGAIEGVRLGVAAMQAGEMNVIFNFRTAENIAAGIDYVSSSAFQDAIAFYGGYHAEQISLLVIEGIARGQSAAAMWAQISQYLDATARADWTRLLRTLQNYSARRGTLDIYRRNGVKEWIWSANIGDVRTCVMCYVMHGTRHPVSDMLDEHHNGRCAMLPVTPTWAELGFGDGIDEPIQTGLDWLAGQPMEVQQQILGPQLFNYWRNGQAVLSPETVTEVYHNPIFGDMRRRASNTLILERSRIV